MLVRSFALGIIALAAPVGGAVAQGDAAAQRFLAEARAGTRRYSSQQAAIADGFRRVGVEFPAMGEHWVSLARVMADTLDAARPSVLIYVNVKGTPRLAGVAYTDLLDPGDPAPRGPAPGAWHEHNGAIDEESLPLGHHGAHEGSSVAEGAPRLSILHAWVWTANPDGPFVTDNWALPFLRFGLSPDRMLARDVVRALALAADDEGYHLLMIRTAVGISPAEEPMATRVITAHRGKVLAIAGSLDGAKTLDTAQQEALAAEWARLWRELADAFPRHASRLAALRAQL